MEKSVTQEVADTVAERKSSPQDVCTKAKNADLSAEHVKQEVAIVLEMNLKQDEDSTDFPGKRCTKWKLSVLMCVLVLYGLVFLGMLDLFPLYVYYKGVRIDTWHSVLIVVVSSGLSFSVFCLSVSAVIDVIWILGLFQYLWNKILKLSDITRWDYITDTLMTVNLCLTNGGLVVLLVSSFVYQIFIRYDALTLMYEVDNGLTESSTQTVSEYMVIAACCIVFKALFYTFIEYYKILMIWCHTRLVKRQTHRKVTTVRAKSQPLDEVKEQKDAEKEQNKDDEAMIQG